MTVNDIIEASRSLNEDELCDLVERLRCQLRARRTPEIPKPQESSNRPIPSPSLSQGDKTIRLPKLHLAPDETTPPSIPPATPSQEAP